MSLNPIFEGICTSCGEKMTVYDTYSTYCPHCEKTSDLGMFRGKSTEWIKDWLAKKWEERDE